MYNADAALVKKDDRNMNADWNAIDIA